MRQFIAHFGEHLASPWTKLVDVPKLTDELIETVTRQSDAQSGEHTPGELERIRDRNLVGILRALEDTDWGAGRVTAEMRRRLDRPNQDRPNQDRPNQDRSERDGSGRAGNRSDP